MMNDSFASAPFNRPWRLLGVLQVSATASILALSTGLSHAQPAVQVSPTATGVPKTQPTVPVTPKPQAATTSSQAKTSTPDRQAVQGLLQQVQRERELQNQASAEARRQYNQATVLLIVLSIILGLILAAAVAMLLILRRAVIREVAEVVQSHLKEVRDLKAQLSQASDQVERVAEQTDTLKADLSKEWLALRNHGAQQREAIAQLVDEAQRKQQQSLKE
ncbi:MAG TPA: hypothetical protein V6D19_07840, partial [Stenomitos sp.]